MQHIIFTGGGTGGHVYPALAVYNQMPDPLARRVVWIGSRHGIERAIVVRAGIPYHAVPTGKLRRYLDFRNITDLFRVAAGFFSARTLLRRLRAQVVFSKGGFVAVPVVLAAASLRIPVIIHESDGDPGLATRITAPVARRILLPYAETSDQLPQRLARRMRVTGNPVRRAFTERWDETELTRHTALVHRELNLAAPDPARPLPRLLVTGGSLGALQLNTLLSQTIAALTSEAFVIHQTGAHSEEMIPSIAAAAAPGRYAAAATFDSLFPAIVRTADLVIARAGAGTIWEIAVAGRPSILIPLSRGASRGDQIRNARRYAHSGAAVVLEDPDLSAAEFLAVVRRLLRDPDRRDAMGAAAREWAPADAADRIVAEIGTVIDESVSVRAAASDSGTVL